MAKRPTPSQIDKDKMVNLYLSGFSQINASASIGYTHTALRTELHKRNIIIRPASVLKRRFHCNESFFENIDCESKAYWLGFISADGYISKKGNVDIELSIKDEEHLYKFKRDIEADYNIIRLKPKITPNNYIVQSVRISVFSKKMIEDLNKLGVNNKKSLTIEAYKNMNFNLKKHYYRGWIDGDGCLRSYRLKGSNNLQWEISLVGTNSVLSSFLEYILENNIITHTKLQSKQNIFILRFGGTDLPKKIIKLLYENATVFLDRKMALAQECMNG